MSEQRTGLIDKSFVLCFGRSVCSTNKANSRGSTLASQREKALTRQSQEANLISSVGIQKESHIHTHTHTLTLTRKHTLTHSHTHPEHTHNNTHTHMHAHTEHT